MENGFITDYPYEHHSVDDFVILANEKLSDLDYSIKSGIQSIQRFGHCDICPTIRELFLDEHNLSQLQQVIPDRFGFLLCQNSAFTSKNIRIVK